MAYLTPPNVRDTSNLKQHLKHTFVHLLWDLFSAENPVLPSSPSVKFSNDPKSDNMLHVFTRFPNVQRELPSVVVSLRGLSGTRKTVNQHMPKPYYDHLIPGSLPAPDDGEHHRKVQGFDVRGFVQFDIMTLNDTTRDELIDRLVDFFIWRGENAAKLDAKMELEDRWIGIDVDNYALSGDQEMPLEESTSDLVYTDGLAIPFIAEMYHFGTDLFPLERVDTEVQLGG